MEVSLGYKTSILQVPLYVIGLESRIEMCLVCLFVNDTSVLA